MNRSFDHSLEAARRLLSFVRTQTVQVLPDGKRQRVSLALQGEDLTNEHARSLKRLLESFEQFFRGVSFAAPPRWIWGEKDVARNHLSKLLEALALLARGDTGRAFATPWINELLELDSLDDGWAYEFALGRFGEEQAQSLNKMLSSSPLAVIGVKAGLHLGLETTNQLYVQVHLWDSLHNGERSPVLPLVFSGACTLREEVNMLLRARGKITTFARDYVSECCASKTSFAKQISSAEDGQAAYALLKTVLSGLSPAQKQMLTRNPNVFQTVPRHLGMA